MSESVYRRLADHLDRLPGGFAPSTTGAEMPLLQHLFAPDEADLAVHLTLDREPADVIAARAGLPAAETTQRLERMAQKGLIFTVNDTKRKLYSAAPWIVGIYEFQINNLTPAFREVLFDYWGSIAPRDRPATIPQMRTVPVHESVDVSLEALPYERVYQLVEASDRFAVAPCICRKQAQLSDRGCDAPLETCLMFDDWADFYVEGGRGRAIDREEVMAILARADEHNLVLQPANSKDADAICCCCGCCCGILGGLKQQPRPADAVASAFIAQFDADLCISCWTCLDRCQMDAFSVGGASVKFDAGRCIGCGLCVTTCPSGALTLTRKPPSDRMLPPDTFLDTWKTIADAQAGAGT